MKYRIEYESAKDGMTHTIEIEGNSDQSVLKKLVEKYHKMPSKILSCRRIEDMKSYKIGNKVIKANSVEDALRVNKMLDNRVKDGSFKIRNANQYKGYLDQNGKWVSYFYAKKFKSKDDAKEFGKKLLGNESFVIEFSANDSIHDVDLEKYQMWVDFDMDHYKKISEETMDAIHKAGLSVVKDQYGQYEVIAKDPDHDSIEDDDFINSLSEEEKQAIEDYRKAIAGTNDPKLLELYAHILKEEVEHLDELQNAKEGEFTEDAEAVKNLEIRGFEIDKKTLDKYKLLLNNYISSNDLKSAKKVSEEYVRALRRRQQQFQELYDAIPEKIRETNNEIAELESIRKKNNLI